MGPDVNLLAAKWDGAGVAGLKQDADRVQGELQFRAKPDEYAAHLRDFKWENAIFVSGRRPKT